MNSTEFLKETNKFLGHALELLPYPSHPLVGREKELKDMEYVLNRPDTPVLLLLGDAGSGKTALVEEYRKREEQREGKDIVLLSLNFGRLSADGINKLQERFSVLIPRLLKYQELLKQENPTSEVILFMDEIHQVISIFGSGTKIGGDLLKPALARKGIKVIGATTRQEYDTYIAVDKPLDRRFKKLEINILSKENIRQVLRQWLISHLGKDGELVSNATIDYVIDSNALYREHYAEPASSIDILETAIAMSKVDHKPIDKTLINRVFKQLNINLDYKINYQHVKETIANQVKGQPIAIYNVDHLLKKITFDLERSQKPLLSALFVGTTGTGKAIADDELVPVYLKNGSTMSYIRHGDLCVGDYVVGEDGYPTRVNAIYPNGEKEAFEVFFDDGSSVICNDEHLFDVIIDGKRETLTVKALQEKLPSHRVLLPQNHPVQINRCEVNRDHIDYVVDYLATDLEYQYLDEEIPSEWQRALENNRIPKEVLFSSVRTRQYLLKELLKRNSKVIEDNIYCKYESKMLTKQIMKLANSLGIPATMEEHMLEKGQGFESIAHIHCGFQQLRKPQSRRMVQIVPLEEKIPMTCIEVENETHCYYVTERFILTHNTQTVKALLEGMYGEDGQMVNLSMTDYKGSDAEARFRHKIGKAVLHNPNTVILLDEFEKCNRDVLEVMYPILDEGSVTFEEIGQDGYAFQETVSLRNAIIIATSNAGQHLMSQESKYGRAVNHINTQTLIDASDELKRDVQDLEGQLIDALITEGIPDALIGRFDQIVPFFALNDDSKIAIIDKRLKQLVDTIKKEKGIEIILPQPQSYERTGIVNYKVNPITMFVLYERNGSQDSEKGGARKLIRTIDHDIFYKILDAIFAYPTVKRFRITTNGKCGFEDQSNIFGDGDVIVTPV